MHHKYRQSKVCTFFKQIYTEAAPCRDIFATLIREVRQRGTFCGGYVGGVAAAHPVAPPRPKREKKEEAEMEQVLHEIYQREFKEDYLVHRKEFEWAEKRFQGYELAAEDGKRITPLHHVSQINCLKSRSHKLF